MRQPGIPAEAPTPTFQSQAILQAVAEAFDVSVEALTEREHGRSRVPAEAREAAILLLAEFSDLSPTEIGRSVGGRDPEAVARVVALKDRYLLDPLWAEIYRDAAEGLTGVRPAAPPRLMDYDGYPVRVIEIGPRTARLQFIGNPPPGFGPIISINREIIRPAPDLGTAAQALEAYLFWARPLIETGAAWPDLERQYRAAESALATLVRGAAAPASPRPVPVRSAGAPRV